MEDMETQARTGQAQADGPCHAVGKQAKERLAVLSPIQSAELYSSEGNLQLPSLQLRNQRAGICQ